MEDWGGSSPLPVSSFRVVIQIVIVEGLLIGLMSWLIASLLAFPLGKIMTVVVGISFI
jgi:hypothetical protein